MSSDTPISKPDSMDDFAERIVGLSPAKRALLQLRLKNKGFDESGAQIITRRANRDSAPLSFAQQRLWFLDQFEPNSPLYNIPKAFRLSGPLNVAALEQSLSELLRRHEALRTTFATVEEQPVQIISPARPLSLPMVDLRRLPETERKAEVQRLVVEEAQRPFNLAKGPLLRTTLVRLGEEEHVLILVMHHIVSDGWSMGVLLQELGTLYRAFSIGKPSPLPDLPVQFADFAYWQRQWLQGDVLEQQLSYWKHQLGGSLPTLELPTARTRPAIQTFRGAKQPLVLSNTLTKGLKALSRQEGVTLFMTLLAAFQTLLRRYTGQDDILVGSAIAGRTLVETEGLIGFFVNTLVFRTDLSGNPSFSEMMARVREVALGAYAHQDLPFEKLVEELEPERDLSRNPLFQVWFALQYVPRQALDLPGVTISPVDFDIGTAKFDLSLSMIEEGEGLRGSFEYNRDLFDEGTIKRMIGHFQTLLEGIAADPHRSISSLPFLTEAERHQLLTEWNDTKRDYPEDRCIHQLFEAQVERTPDAVAVAFENQQLTYRELNQRANQLAHYLRALGVGPEILVGIYLDRSLEMVVGLLGILKAGGAYVPLDPSFPKERLAFMLEDSRLPVLLTHQRLVDELPKHEAQLVCLDDDWELIAQESKEEPVSGATPDNRAYVIFTSGSTGKPKGVEIPHRAVVNFLASLRQQPGLTERDTLLSVTTLSFDIAALEIFLPMTVGARVVVVSREVASEGARLLERLAHSGTTAMQATPATWRLLLEAGWQGNNQLKILCGGEALPRELAAQLLAKGSSLWNLYGPTETTIWSAVHRVDSGDGPIPIGRPIANTQIHILDSHLQTVPVGVVGELYIGGTGLAQGYLNRPELTAEKFLPDPFSEEPGARLYRTGDLARYRPDGNIEFLGRLDHQVKLRGFRIELGEIEAVLSQHPAVQQVIVLAREDTAGDKRLVAYVVPKQESLAIISDLRSLLKEKLPEYMVPSAFALLNALPLTPNGKVDRRALPAPDQSRPEQQRPFVAPRTPVEKSLAQIWAEVLKVEKVGIHDNFFDLGGHSLLAIQVISRVREAFHIEFPLRALFEKPTIDELAKVIIELEAQKIGAEELGHILADIDSLSDEEVQERVARGNIGSTQSPEAADNSLRPKNLLERPDRGRSIMEREQ